MRKALQTDFSEQISLLVLLPLNINGSMMRQNQTVKIAHQLLELDFLKNVYLCIYLFMAVLGLCCCICFSLVAANGGYSLVSRHGLLIAVASVGVACRFPCLRHMGSEAVPPRLYGVCV